MDADQNSELSQQRSAATGRGSLRHRFKRLLDNTDNNQVGAKKQRAEDCTEASGCTGKTHSDWLSNTYYTGWPWGQEICETDSDNEGDVVVESRMRPQPPELMLLGPNKPAAAPPSPPKPPTPWHALNAHAALLTAPVGGAAADTLGNKAFADHKPWNDTKVVDNVAPTGKHLPSPGPMEANADKQLQSSPASSPAAGFEAHRNSEDVQMQMSADNSPKPTAQAKTRPDTPASSAFSKGAVAEKLWPANYNPYLRRYLRTTPASGKLPQCTGKNLHRLEACMADAGECEDAFLSSYQPPPLPEDWEAEE